MWSSARRAWRSIKGGSSIYQVRHSVPAFSEQRQQRWYTSWDKKLSNKFRPKIPKYSPKTLARLRPGQRYSTKFSAQTLAKMNQHLKKRPRPERPRLKYFTGRMYPADPFEGYNPKYPGNDSPRNDLQVIRTMSAHHGYKVIQKYVPLAHRVIHEMKVLEEGVTKLMESIPVKTCTICMEVHVGAAGHQIRSCRGSPKSLMVCELSRYGETLYNHRWIRAWPEDVLLTVKSYHVFDKLKPNLQHRWRYRSSRLSVVRELCFHAGVDDPEFPMIRFWREYPASRDGEPSDEEDSEGDEDSSSTDEPRKLPSELQTVDEVPSELKMVAERTLVAYEEVRRGVMKLMKQYQVWACGYCPEVHVGFKAHSVRCVSFRRVGKHAWQRATLSDIFPPNFVWHVPEHGSRVLKSDLKAYYGQAPAVVELCVQAGAEAPQMWLPHMRMDAVIPTEEEDVLAA